MIILEGYVHHPHAQKAVLNERSPEPGAVRATLVRWANVPSRSGTGDKSTAPTVRANVKEI
jgi:hypothetical protein